MEVCGIDLIVVLSLKEIDLFILYEVLLLGYEEVLICCDYLLGDWYDCFVYFVWIGECICQLDYVYIEFFKGIKNLIGVKVGFGMDLDELIKFIDVINLDNIFGCLILIIRMGVDVFLEKLLVLVCKV